MSKPKIKARRWRVDAREYDDTSNVDAILYKAVPFVKDPAFQPVAVLKVSDEEALVEQVSSKISELMAPEGMDHEEKALVDECARAVLTSLGIIRKK